MKIFLCLLLLLVSLGQELISLKGGTMLPFIRSRDPKKPTRVIEVASYSLQRTPVTNKQYLEFVRRYPQWRRSQVRSVYAEKRYLLHWKDDLHFDPALADSPVCYVSWFAARAYCESQNLRLPTTNEWEFAAQVPQAETILEWYSHPTPKKLPPVGSGWRSPQGVWDLHGLVWEWVEDFNSVLVTGSDSGLFCAGASQSGADPKDYAAFMRFGFRSSLKARYCLPNLGFRAAGKKGLL